MGRAAREGLAALAAAYRAVLALVVLAGLLAGCASGGVQPFSKATRPSGRTPPAIIVRALTGLPPDKEKLLFDSLVAAAGPRDVAIVQGDFQGGYSLTGQFQAVADPSGVVLNYSWTLVDDKGRVLHNIANSEIGRPVTGDPWGGVDPDLLRRVAATTAENLSSRLSQLGFATVAEGIPPPLDTLAEAGPDAEKDIDPTLYGVNAAAVMWPQAVGSIDPLPPAPQTTAPEPEKVPAEAVTAKTRAEARTVEEPQKSEAGGINAVAVTGVTGSPGRGNRELAAAMRQVLGDAGWPVFEKARSDALSIEGKVKLGKRNGKTQKVELSWTVKMPDGKVLGTIGQANDIPAGSLDKGWGKAAGHAARGAADGIFNLVSKVQKKGG